MPTALLVYSCRGSAREYLFTEVFLRMFDELIYVRISTVCASLRIDRALHFGDGRIDARSVEGSNFTSARSPLSASATLATSVSWRVIWSSPVILNITFP